MSAATIDHDYELDHRYTRESGRVYLTGVQALVRLPMLQRLRDEAAGLNTAGFISGYRGSPLGTYDMALWQAKELLEEHRVRFEPGVNEDLAATAVWGTQQVSVQPRPIVDGVFSIWYGKGPGVDRSTDAIKHGNYLGTAKHGGVLALAGDDPTAKSSSIAHQSEPVLIHCGMPILNPANVQEYLDLGLHGFGLSRYSGCWVGFKCLTDTVDSAASVEVGLDRVRIVTPEFDFPAQDHHITMNNVPLQIERQLALVKLPAAQAYVKANGLDRTIFGGEKKRLGIVTTGKAYLDVRQSLEELGIDEARAGELGLQIYKVAMTWPLEPDGIRDFCRGLDDVLVVEEKRPIVEEQLARILYNERERPRLLGKRDDRGAPLIPEVGELSSGLIREVLRAWIHRHDERFAASLRPAPATSQVAPGEMMRLPSFCSGCPHSTSTVVPDGSIALGGIGCHGMATWMPERNTFGATQMGGEGSNWIGQSPFVEMPHVFQNLGDGTYFHSGLLSVRACVAADVNITFKVLVNGAVAMTGGQPIEGEPMEGEITCPEIARQLLAEGVKRIAVVSNEPEKFGPKAFPLGGTVTVHHRDQLLRVQKRLREIDGVTAILYDQTCAAEARRLRKQGRFPDPDRRVMINEGVCEGCGDCSVQSSCISIEPIETVFGRKRTINQSSCNKDFSCLKGYCPSFVTVEGGTLRKAEAPKALGAGDDGPFASLPLPETADCEAPFSILLAGIGGTGVVTVGAILSMAAHLERKGSSELDVTGLSQKNGAVSSHVRIANEPEALHATRIGAGMADVVIGCDAIVTTGFENLPKIGPASTVLLNDHVAPTADFATNADLDFSVAPMADAARAAAGEANTHLVAATHLATALMGDAVYTNIFLLGVAFQLGRLPVGLASLERAIALNGRAVDANRRAFSWGRLYAHDRAAVEKAAAPLVREEAAAVPTLDEIVAHRSEHLTAYQNRALAERYRALVDRVGAREEAVRPGSRALASAVATYYAKLLAIKDEYEVARLWTNGDFHAQLTREFEGDPKLTLHLASDHLMGPWLAPRDPDTGRAKKIPMPAWLILPVFRVMATLKFLRGTPLNVFGYREHRKLERQLVADYERTVDELLGSLTDENLELAVEIAALPEGIRGFDLVKEAQLASVREKEAELRHAFGLRG